MMKVIEHNGNSTQEAPDNMRNNKRNDYYKNSMPNLKPNNESEIDLP
jgi:hypothetical protein